MASAASSDPTSSPRPALGGLVRRVARKKRSVDKPCKYFGTGQPCPFGDGCWYVHDAERWAQEHGERLTEPESEVLSAAVEQLAASGEVGAELDQQRDW